MLHEYGNAFTARHICMSLNRLLLYPNVPTSRIRSCKLKLIRNAIFVALFMLIMEKNSIKRKCICIVGSRCSQGIVIWLLSAFTITLEVRL